MLMTLITLKSLFILKHVHTLSKRFFFCCFILFHKSPIKKLLTGVPSPSRRLLGYFHWRYCLWTGLPSRGTGRRAAARGCPSGSSSAGAFHSSRGWTCDRAPAVSSPLFWLVTEEEEEEEDTHEGAPLRLSGREAHLNKLGGDVRNSMAIMYSCVWSGGRSSPTVHVYFREQPSLFYMACCVINLKNVTLVFVSDAFSLYWPPVYEPPLYSPTL